jgi:hypothetical protein
MFRKTARLGALSASVFALAISLVFTQAAFAKAKPHSVHDPAVTACGTLSLSNVIYVVTVDINTASTGNCLVLTGHDASLDLNGHNIAFTGPAGTSVGAGVKVTGDFDVVDGFDGTVSGFAVGVLDQANNTVGDAINMMGNGIGLELSGGTDIWTNFFASSNTAQGVYVNSCSDECTISDFQSDTNGGDGVLITGSDGARASVFEVAGNGGNGVHVGCSSSSCGGGESSNSEVRIGDAPVGFETPGEGGVDGNALDGVLLDKSEGSNRDQVFLVKSLHNTGIDLHDVTTTCGNNHWFHDNYSTAKAGATVNPACIPNVPF